MHSLLMEVTRNCWLNLLCLDVHTFSDHPHHILQSSSCHFSWSYTETTWVTHIDWVSVPTQLVSPTVSKLIVGLNLILIVIFSQSEKGLESDSHRLLGQWTRRHPLLYSSGREDTHATGATNSLKRFIWGSTKP